MVLGIVKRLYSRLLAILKSCLSSGNSCNSHFFFGFIWDNPQSFYKP